MFKKSMLAVIIVLMCFLLGCNKKSDSSSNPSNAPTESETASDSTLTKQDETTSENTSESNSETPTVEDTTGDYMGNIESPLPPDDSSYTIYNSDDHNDCIALYVSNVDKANIKFYIVKALFNEETFKSEESKIFDEHIAHYNGDGYYEYVDKEYHLYFKYADSKEEPELPGNKTVEVYGLEGLYKLSQYGEVLSYNGINGNRFTMNVPFAG